MAAIIISDNGPGMTPEVVAKVREPMFTTKNFGTGLGIPAVEQIMAQHGGHLDIASTPGVGSRFTMLLPLKQAAPDGAVKAA
jgi:signal transduction histidine kinase